MNAVRCRPRRSASSFAPYTANVAALLEALDAFVHRRRLEADDRSQARQRSSARCAATHRESGGRARRVLRVVISIFAKENICRKISGDQAYHRRSIRGKGARYPQFCWRQFSRQPAAVSRRPARRPATVRFDLAADPQTAQSALRATPTPLRSRTQLARLSFEPFVDLDARGRPEPALLARIPDARKRRHLRPTGARFATDLRARRALERRACRSLPHDVLFTLHAILDPRNPVRSHEGYDLIDRAYAPDAQHGRRAPATRLGAGGRDLLLVRRLAAVRAAGARAAARKNRSRARAFNAAPTSATVRILFVSWRRGEGLRYDRQSALLAR